MSKHNRERKKFHCIPHHERTPYQRVRSNKHGKKLLAAAFARLKTK